MQEIRCNKCNKLLFKISTRAGTVKAKAISEGEVVLPSIEIQLKCPRCGIMCGLSAS